MTHATEGMLQAWLDDELAEGVRAELAGHLAACAQCADEAAALRAVNDRVRTALAVLDVPAPALASAPALRQRVAPAPAARGVARLRGSLSRAAGLVLVTVGAASAAIPGSPVRSWITGAWDRVSSLFVGERTAPVADAPVTVPAADEAYAAVALADGQVRVMLAQPTGVATLRVRLIDGNRARFFSTDTGVRYVSATGRLEISEISGGDVTIELPRGARLATVEVAGVRMADVQAGNLRAHVPAMAASEAEVVFRLQR
jgi:hypothetical protein